MRYFHGTPRKVEMGDARAAAEEAVRLADAALESGGQKELATAMARMIEADALIDQAEETKHLPW